MLLLMQNFHYSQQQVSRTGTIVSVASLAVRFVWSSHSNVDNGSSDTTISCFELNTDTVMLRT
jgi:hypothetical protein